MSEKLPVHRTGFIRQTEGANPIPLYGGPKPSEVSALRFFCIFVSEMAASDKYPPLNLPPAALRTRHTGNKPEVWDPLRRKWLVLTPEEWVRQHFIRLLTDSYGVDPYRIVQEQALSIDGFTYRADIVVYSRQAEPRLVVECKAATVAITQEVFDQVAHYNIRLGVPYLVVTNGLRHYCCEIDHTARSYRFINEIPQHL